MTFLGELGTMKKKRMKPVYVLLASLVVMAFLLSISTTAVAAAPASAVHTGGGFNAAGNVLITDQFNNRVIEVNPLSGKIVWSFGSNDPNDMTPIAGHIIAPNWAERLSGGLTIMAGTGTTLVPDNRVIVVNQCGEIVWQYGQGGVAGDGPNQLNAPVCAIQLPNHDILITDQANNRIIEVNLLHHIVWSYGPASGPGALNSPNSAELLTNGHILIADEGNNRVIEIDRCGNIVWQYSGTINGAAFASRLPNGDTLITDAGNARILEVNHCKQIVFQYFTNTDPKSNPAPAPTNAVKLKNGNIIIADQFNDRAFIINACKQIIWQYGKINVVGNTHGLLNAPYTAFVIGDFTGQTVPPHSFYPYFHFEKDRIWCN
jgi:outer membrane protein assembly factor BamB